MRKKAAKKNSGGRPRRTDSPQKLNLFVAKRAKQRAFAMASNASISISKFFENLVDKAHSEKTASA